MIKQTKKEFIKNLCEDIEVNSKHFWSYARSKSSVKESVLKVIYQNGELTNTDLKTVNEINRATFQNVFTQETEHNIPNFYIDI